MELAHTIGSTRESVSSTLSEISKEGIVLSGRMKISIRKRLIQEKEAPHEI